MRADTKQSVLSEAARVYCLPIALSLLAWVPNDTVRGLLFSLHGGLGWGILALSFPFLVVRLIVVASRKPEESRPRRRKIAGLLAAGYVPLSALCAYSIVKALNLPPTNFRKILLIFYI